jgi:hypothetical protein
VLLYELFTQQLPFRGSSMAIIAQALVKEPPPPIQLRSDLDPRINAACLKMMAKAPEDRFSSLAEVADELETILENPDAKPILNLPADKPSSPPSAERVAAAQRRHSLAAQFLAKRALSEQELTDIEKSARRYFDLRQYEKLVEMVEQVPERQRPARLQGLLADACGKTTEIAALVAALDEAAHVGNRATALQRAQALLKLQPRHPRACEVITQFEQPRVGFWKVKPRTLWTAVLVGLTLLAALIVALAGRE